MLKTALIMRGIPGSGKSTLARDLQNMVPDGLTVAIHSTDNLCYVNGEYRFSFDLAGARHAQNLENFIAAMDYGVDLVICDNTNITRGKYQRYVDEAVKRDYRVAFVEMLHPDLETAVARNAHGVPLEAVRNMAETWQPTQAAPMVEPKWPLIVTAMSVFAAGTVVGWFSFMWFV